IVVRTVNKVNDTKNPLTYLHRSMLRREFSVTGRWESINIANTVVMADVVAMDSELPLKKRDSITRASGEITKIGMKLYLTEKQLTELNLLISNNPTSSQIGAKLFQDTKRVINGVYERLEKMFLEGLSTGVTVVEDTEN